MLLFVGISLFVVFGLSLFAAWVCCLALGFGGPHAFGATVLLIAAHGALPLLSGSALVGLLMRRRWAWWIALAGFGLLAAMAAMVAFLIFVPVPLLGGEVDADWWPLALGYAICAWPGTVMLFLGRDALDALR
ncbi:MAG TPA: hypothetical protein VF950_15725 [Planctomycetota bacterium]